MKIKLFLFSIFLFSQTATKAQSPSIEWQKTFGGSNIEYGSYIYQTADGGFIIAGSTSSTDGDVISNHGNRDYWVLKTNATGTIEWQKTYGGTNNEFLRTVTPTADGGYIISGNSSSTDGDVTGNHGAADIWIVKINGIGDIQWQKSLGGTGSDSAGYAIQTSDGGYIVSGIVTSTDGDVVGHHGGLRDCWVAKLNNLGEISWSRTLGGSSDENSALKILQTTDGGYLLIAYTASTNGDVVGNHGNYDVWVVKLHAIGFVLWQKCYGGTGSELATDIIQTTDGGYIISGASDLAEGQVTENNGSMDYWIVKINSTGILEWQKSFGGSALEHAMAIQQTTDGGYIIIGYSSSNDFDVTGSHGSSEVWVIKTNENGEMQWQKALGGSGEDSSDFIIQTQDGGFAFTGTTRSTDGDITSNHGIADFWVVKLLPEELATDDFLTSNFKLYPNPNNGNFTIDFKTNDFTGKKEISIYNLLGQMIYEATTEAEQVNVNLNGKPKGIYTYRVTKDNKLSASGKILIE